ncbi:terpenoid synthase [Trametopsis cervina]|nr:terpenoid synthase [Trametopsis cervina]
MSECSSVSGIGPENIATISRRAVLDFFHQTEISMQRRRWCYDSSGQVEQRFLQGLSEWHELDFMADKYKKAHYTSVCVATTMFGHTHLDTQVFIALYSLLAGCVDDLEIDDIALEEFAPRINSGAPQLHPILDLLVQHLRRARDYYPAYSSTAIFAGTIQFVNATWFDRRCGTNIGMPLQKDALPYVRFKRARNSLGEVYNLFAWDKFNFPDVTRHIQILPVYLDYANDILSFYKEECAGEKDNFVHDRAVVTGKPLSAVLSDMLEELVKSVKQARVIIQDERARSTWEEFIEGYVAFHLLSPRYRLEELLGPKFISELDI